MHGAGVEVLPVDVWLAIATILLCVALSAFFSASETALTAASRARMHALEKNGDRRAALVNRLLVSRARLISTTLLGQTLVSVGSSAFLTSILVALAGERGALYVMVHRTNMLALNADLPSQELIREVVAAPYSRLPLWRGQPENIVGVLHAKDLLRALDTAGGEVKDFKVESIALEPWFVPETTPVQNQLQAFLKRKAHFALVVDEYGVVMGLVTLEDILEEIVGDIADEHDLIVQGVRLMSDGAVIVDGSVPIRDLNRAMSWNLPDEEATTIAGLVINEARAIPEPGQVFAIHNFRFEVLRKTRNRITSLKIMPVEPGASARRN